jgi:ubiquinone/menaquinone biosynthesis C-methylase UbiE
MFKMRGKQLSKPSGLFGRIVARSMEKGNRNFYKKTIPMLNIQSGDKVFEIGYGTGYVINYLANNSKGCTFCGIDYSELMYKQATKRNKEFIDSGIMKLGYGDILTANLGSEKYNKVFCINVIYFWDDLSKAFNKVYTMLEEQGVYYLFMAHKEFLEGLNFTENFNKYSIEKVESELKKAGFKNVEYKLDGGYIIKAVK